MLPSTRLTSTSNQTSRAFSMSSRGLIGARERRAPFAQGILRRVKDNAIRLRQLFVRGQPRQRSYVHVPQRLAPGPRGSEDSFPAASSTLPGSSTTHHTSPSQTHLVIFINGLFGSPGNWDVICEEVEKVRLRALSLARLPATQHPPCRHAPPPPHAAGVRVLELLVRPPPPSQPPAWLTPPWQPCVTAANLRNTAGAGSRGVPAGGLQRQLPLPNLRRNRRLWGAPGC
jgi:hypothetical protein